MGALRQAVEDEMAEAFAAVSWQVETDAEAVTRRLNPLIAQVVFYAAREALRNAARHAHDLSDRPLCARVSVTWQHGLMLRIEDDGVGLPATAAAGSGPGHGLALHSTLMTVIGGTLTVESAPGTGTRVVLHLPQSAIGEGLTSDPVAIGG
jgi:signal transduction histidine kinase